jgi:UDP-N-acetyl-2-amino-2-deoxyglucuronate dehydrogenase
VWDRNLESSITVIGSKGSVKIGRPIHGPSGTLPCQDYEMPVLEPTNPANDYGAYKGSASNHHYIIENVVDTLKGRQTMTTNALEGMKVIDIIERIYQKRDERPI